MILRGFKFPQIISKWLKYGLHMKLNSVSEKNWICQN